MYQSTTTIFLQRMLHFPSMWYNKKMVMNFLFLIIAYLLGSIPSGLWIGQVFFKKNLRDYGSGNTGTTNTFRILGPSAGILVFAIDFLKGTLAVWLPIVFHANGWSPIVFGLVAVLGHTFPLFAGFKGGKAVATSAGMLMGFSPVYCLFLLAIFSITLYLSSMVSLSSVVSAGFAIITVIVFPAFHFILPEYDFLFTVIIVFLGAFVILRHRENIIRIQQKTENLVPFGLNLTKQAPIKK